MPVLLQWALPAVWNASRAHHPHRNCSPKRWGRSTTRDGLRWTSYDRNSTWTGRRTAHSRLRSIKNEHHWNMTLFAQSPLAWPDRDAERDSSLPYRWHHTWSCIVWNGVRSGSCGYLRLLEGFPKYCCICSWGSVGLLEARAVDKPWQASDTNWWQ